MDYNYELSFTAAEFLGLLDVAVQTRAQDRVSRALGMGAVATLRELLDGQPPEIKEEK